MSKFITRIPVDIEAVKRCLPPGAFFHGVQAGLGFESIDLVWEHDQLKTPWDYAIEFPAGMLGSNAVPKGVSDLRGIVQSPKPKVQSREGLMADGRSQMAKVDPPSPPRLRRIDPTTPGKGITRGKGRGVKGRL